MSETGQIEDRSEVDKDQPQSAKFWHMELTASHNREKNWRDRAEKVVKRFEDQRSNGLKDKGKKFNILWSNTEVLRSALTIATSKPDVRRRYGTNDKVGRFAALTLERAVDYSTDESGAYDEIALCVEDAILPGRAVAWVVYDPDVGEGEDGEEISSQRCFVEWVYWADYREGHARCWKKMPWVARAHYMSRKELEDLNEEHGKKVPLNATVVGTTQEDGKQEVMRRGLVWEIWDKASRQRHWVSEDYPTILRSDDDPYGLERFWPVPEPWYAVKSNRTREPIPLYTQYQDQAAELDRITERINRLIEHLKWRGVYDASQEDNAQLQDLARAGDGEFLPVKSWASFAEKGGMRGAIQEMDIQTIAQVVLSLQQERAQLVQEIYEVTGISDIIRGSTDPRETKGAQQLKAQFGSMRMQSLTNDKEKFVREIYEIKSELIAEHYQQNVLAQITQVDLPTREQINAEVARITAQAQVAQIQGQQIPPQVEQQVAKLQEVVTWDDVMEVLRSDRRRGYSVNVETDQTVLQDAEQEKAARSEVVGTVIDLMNTTMQAAQVNPGIVPLARELTMFMLAAHKVGRSIEEAVEDAFERMGQAQANPQPDPEAEKAKMELEQTKLETDAKKQELQLDAAGQQMELQGKRAELEMDQQKAALDVRVAEAKAGHQIAVMEAKRLTQQDQGIGAV